MTVIGSTLPVIRGELGSITAFGPLIITDAIYIDCILILEP